MPVSLQANIRFTNAEALSSAARVMGGKAYGLGEHRLGDQTVVGFAFALPGWRQPLIAAQDGSLQMEREEQLEEQDKDLVRFKRWYVLSVVGQTARDNRWRTHFDVDSGTLTIRHPRGARLSVNKDGAIDVNNFVEPGSAEAVSKIEEALSAPPQPLRTAMRRALQQAARPQDAPENPAGHRQEPLFTAEELLAELPPEEFELSLEPHHSAEPEQTAAAPVIEPPPLPPPPLPPPPPRIRLVVANAAAAKESGERHSWYAGRGDLFWSILAETGLVPRRLNPEEFAILADFGIALVDVGKAKAAKGKRTKAGEYDCEGFASQLASLSPQVVVFNGKQAAAAALNLPLKKVEYGLLPERLGEAQLFVLPSTATKARSQWDPRHWFDLARLLTALTAEEAASERAGEQLLQPPAVALHAAPRQLSYRSVVTDLAALLCERSLRRVINSLQELEVDHLADVDSVLWNPWDELCDQLRSGHFFAWEAYEPAIRRCTEAEVARLEVPELEALWLQCDEAALWQEHGPRGSGYPVEAAHIVLFLLRQLYARALDWNSARNSVIGLATADS